MLHAATASTRALHRSVPLRAFTGADSDLHLMQRAFSPAAPSEEALRLVLDASRLVCCTAGPFVLASPRRPEPSWWLLRHGRMGLGQRAEDGSFVEERSIGPGEWLDVAGSLSRPAGWIQAAVCHSPVELLALPLSGMYEACALDPAFAQAWGGVLAQRVRQLSETVQDMATADVPVRLARWLLRRVDPQAEGPAVTVTLHERKQAIARQLCTTSETLSRTLRRFAGAGMLDVQGYAIVIHDLAALREVARPAGPSRRVPADSALGRAASRRPAS